MRSAASINCRLPAAMAGVLTAIVWVFDMRYPIGYIVDTWIPRSQDALASDAIPPVP